MNRSNLRKLAEQRIVDAKALLDANCWGAAYYLAGYSLECGLKACIMKFVEETGAIFRERKFLDGCWTHKLEVLLKTAGRDKEFAIARHANPQLDNNWKVVTAWTEDSRYELTDETEAKDLFSAITDANNGVLKWVREFW